METLEQINSAEDNRIKRLRDRVHRRPTLKIKDTRYYHSRAKGALNLNLNTRQLGLTPMGIANLIQQKIQSRLTAIELKIEPIQHVRGGKPLTEHGAKLLGVSWPVEN